MFRALAARHSAWLSLLVAAVAAAEPVAGAVPPLAMIRYWPEIASYRPSSADVSGGMPLAARMRVWVALPRPCWAAEASAWVMASLSAFCPCADEIVMPCWRASSSVIWYRISQVKVACVRWTGVSVTTPGYFAAAWLRLVTWLSRVAIEIRWSPTTAAAPILSGVTAQPATARPVTATMADALISLRSTALSLLREKPSRTGQALFGQHRPDDLAAPGQQFSIPQRLTADDGSLRHRYEHRTHRGLQHRLRVQALHPDLARIGQLDRREPDVAARRGDVREPGPPGGHAQPRHLEQVEDRLGRRAVPVGQLLEGGGDVGLGVDGGDPGVGLQPQPFAGHIVVRDVRVDRQLDPDLGFFRRAVALQLVDRLADHPHVQVEPDPGDMPGLLAAEQVARAADLQVLQGHVHARAYLGVLGHGGQALVRGLGQGRLGRVQEVGVGPLRAAADPAADLMQLGQAVHVGAVDDERVGVRDVQARFDDRGRDQHVVLPLPEVDHDLFQLVLVHLPVRHRDPRLRDQLSDLGRDPADRADPVVHEEHLAVAQQLTPDRGGHLPGVPGPDEGEHRVAFLGRGEDGRHLPDPGHAHLQRPRDRGGRHAEHVDLGPQPLEVLLVLDAEPLFLVDDDQAEPGEPGFRLEQLVGADDHVHRAVGQPGQGLVD